MHRGKKQNKRTTLAPPDHLHDLPMHLQDNQIHLQDLKIHLQDLQIHLQDLQIHLQDLHIHLEDLQIHFQDFQICLQELQIQDLDQVSLFSALLGGYFRKTSESYIRQDDLHKNDFSSFGCTVDIILSFEILFHMFHNIFDCKYTVENQHEWTWLSHKNLP